MSNPPYSVEKIYGIRESGKYASLKQTYNELFHIYEKEDYTKGTAFLLGNEGNGLSPELAAAADSRIRIPMEGKLESLNVSIASAILLYEAYRQRR